MTCTMLPRTFVMSLLLVAASVPAVLAEPTLPIVENVDSSNLAEDVRGLLPAMKKVKPDAAAQLERDLNDLANASDSAEAVKAIQKHLDACCLIGVTINPESRVKVARGPAESGLIKDRDVYFLAKVHNEGGVTHELALSGPQLAKAGKSGDGKWLEATVADLPGLAPDLTGRRLQYVILRLHAHEAGKREATLCCDVGQGTQDLGFRAELPILFVVKDP